MFKKRSLATVFSFATALSVLTGCSAADNTSSPVRTVSDVPAQAEESTEETPEAKHFSVVCTIFPEYDWVKEIIGDDADNAEVSYLLDNGADLHNYQPTADDIVKISTCDLFIYVGGESEEWVEDILPQAQNKDMKVVDLMALMGGAAKVEELKEGMQGEHDHEHEHDEDEDESDEHEHEHDEDEEESGEHEHEHEDGEEEYDEHVWLSLKNAKVFCADIERKLAETDPANADKYKSNYDSYISSLNELDRSFEQLTSSASVKTLVFGDRFPFRYFVDDYGLDYYAAFIGCSAESEASFETIRFLADKIDELDCDTVFTLENSNKDIANAVIDNSGRDGVSIAELNSLQSVSQADISGGASYLSLMQKNYDVLAEILK